MVVGAPKSWEADARGDGKSSLAVLMTWLTTHGNYARWQHAGKKKDANREWLGQATRGAVPSAASSLGGNKRRATRASLLQEIVALLHAEGLTHREERDVRSKIRDLEKSFWDAVAWKTSLDESNTQERQIDGAVGDAVTTPSNGPRRDLQTELVKRCRHYETLAPALLADVRVDAEAIPSPEPSTSTLLTVSTVVPMAAGSEQRTVVDGVDVLALSSISDRKLWGGDAVVEGGKTSMDVLLDWLSVPHNYMRWRKDNHDGASATTSKKNSGSKEKLLREIVGEMRRQGLAHRTTRDVRTKVNEIERTVRAAVAWRDKYGEQILARYDDAENASALDEIREGMVSVCKHFEKIGPAMVPLLCGMETSEAAAAAGLAAISAAATSDATQRRRGEEEVRERVDDEDGADREGGKDADGHSGMEEENRDGPPREEEPAVHGDDVPVNGQEAASEEHSEQSLNSTVPSSVAASMLSMASGGHREKRTADYEFSERDQPARKRLATTDRETAQHATEGMKVDELQRQVELDRMHHERRCQALQEEQLQLEVARQQILIIKEKALARHELRQAGVPEAEINRAFPLE